MNKPFVADNQPLAVLFVVALKLVTKIDNSEIKVFNFWQSDFFHTIPKLTPSVQNIIEHMCIEINSMLRFKPGK